jgi:hypothetical protein
MPHHPKKDPFRFALPCHPKLQGFVQLWDAEENVDGEKFINVFGAAEPAGIYKEQLQPQRIYLVLQCPTI